MLLEKWYGDFVINGRAQIQYLANLRFGPVTMAYQGKLDNGRSSTTAVGLRSLALPTVRDESLYWPASGDQPEIIWKGICRRPQFLWQEGHQVVVWEPVVLNGEVVLVRQQQQQPIRGYAERLILNFMPWRLGLKTLKWGRFCGQRHSLVWVEWLGCSPRKRALLDGKVVALRSVEREGIQTEAGCLLIETPHEIVNESLGLGALRAFRSIPAAAVSRFLAGVETKWLAHGILESAEGAVDQGTVLYEEVVWP